MGSWGRQIVETVTSWATGLPARPAGGCRGRGCQKPAEVFLRYGYLTGRRGRVATGTRAMCRACAEAAVRRATRDDPA